MVSIKEVAEAARVCPKAATVGNNYTIIVLRSKFGCLDCKMAFWRTAVSRSNCDPAREILRG